MEIVNGVPTNGAEVTVSAAALDPASSEMAAGYYVHGHLVDVDADFVSANIKHDVVIFGVTGTYDHSGLPITAATVKTGLEGFVNGAKITGTGTKTLTDDNETVAAGYYEATTLSAVDAHLASANIKSGVSIFGKAGAATVQDIATADAAIGNVLLDKTFFSVTGAIKTGTIGPELNCMSFPRQDIWMETTILWSSAMQISLPEIFDLERTCSDWKG
jgi:hypothetical protein